MELAAVSSIVSRATSALSLHIFRTALHAELGSGCSRFMVLKIRKLKVLSYDMKTFTPKQLFTELFLDCGIVSLTAV